MSLPTGWTDAALKDIVAINPANPDTVSSDDTLVSFVPMALVEELTGRLDSSKHRPWREVKKGFSKFQEGDVVVAKITPSMENGKAAIAHGLANGLGAGTTELHVLRPRQGIEPHFLLHYVLQESFRRQARARMTGTAGQLRVPTAFLEEQRIPLPPAAEQARIVETLDSMLSRLDSAVANLEAAQRKLKAYRASVLKAAVEGRLVPTEAELARTESRSYEPANVLLGRILNERRRRWEEAELAKMKAAGKTPNDDKWKAKYSEPEPPDVDSLPSLPEGWCWSTMPQLGEINRGKSKHRPRNDPRLLGGRYPFVQTGDVRRADTWLRDFTATYSDFGLAQSRLWPAGTLCITIAANIAETAILTFDACFPDSVVGFAASEPVLVRYVEMFLRTAKQDLDRYAPATAQKNINLETLERVAVPLPPLAEQGRMIEELDRILSIGSVVEGSIVQQTLRSGRLRQAILSIAFEGKLVDQDPADEAADVLLSRLRQGSGGQVRTEGETAQSRAPKTKRSRKLKAAS